ncbi:unnamed protein product [Haemonchus placei]|uniref:Uncharacterized protein n=1 Tax=Haemonchus placei TaxID=6290 RepID=A0A3P7VEY7_HAEPC|nr:unnamed protein product [Haemonchus placei]
MLLAKTHVEASFEGSEMGQVRCTRSLRSKRRLYSKRACEATEVCKQVATEGGIWMILTCTLCCSQNTLQTISSTDAVSQ